MVGQVVALVTLFAVVVFTLYVWRVPPGPACPRCGRPARQHRGLTPRGMAGWPGVLADCPACGWQGRMRRVPPRAVKAAGHGRGGQS